LFRFFAKIENFKLNELETLNLKSETRIMSDIFTLAGKTFNSRLIIGTGKYRSYDEMQRAHRASGAEMVTVAVNRVPLDRKTESFLDYLAPKMQILPNTAGCYDAEHAVRTARLAREALETDWIKLEVIGDPVTLLPDNEQTLEAARILVKEGFIVLPYFSDDLIMAKKLLDAGCPAVMPLAAPIGSGMGVQNPSNLRIMREQLPDAVIIVDAGVGVPSDAAIAMELGADAILMNTAIAEARDPERMAAAMKLAVEAGRLGYLAGRMPKRLYASASSPIEGAIK
jgi:thiazole synthase